MNRYIFSLLSLSMILVTSCSKPVEVQQPHSPTLSSETQETSIDSPWATTRALASPDSPSFSEIDIDFDHEYDKNTALSFLGGTFFDLESDGKTEFIITGWADQNDAVFTYKDWEIIDITKESGINNSLPSYGAYSIDFDENGYDDLFIARQDGIYYHENTDWKFSEKKLDITLPNNAVPLDIDFADIDWDNDLDMYISTFITPWLFRAAVFNDPNHVQKNLLLQNNWGLSFTDITVSSGLDVRANTFTSSFVDLDEDGDADMVISPNTDSVKIFENTQGNFTLAYESDIYGFWGNYLYCQCFWYKPLLMKRD